MRVPGSLDVTVRTGLKALAAPPRAIEKSSASNALGHERQSFNQDAEKAVPRIALHEVVADRLLRADVRFRDEIEASFLTDLRKDREQESRKNRNNCDDDEQFDQRETAPLSSLSHPYIRPSPRSW